MNRPQHKSYRRGSVYLAVLGTGLIVSLLALSALALQRLQNRMLSASADVRQAQLNAEAAIELGRLTMKQNSLWRTDPSVVWPTNMQTGAGTCSLEVTQIGATSALLEASGWAGPANDPDLAMQKVSLVIDSHYDPYDSLRSGNAAQPNWAALFSYYQDPSNSTAININSIGPPQLARNGDLTLTTEPPPYWTGNVADGASVKRMPAELPIAGSSIPNTSPFLRVYDRGGNLGGAAQYIGALLKPNARYTVTARVRNTNLNILQPDRYRIAYYLDSSSAPTKLGDLSIPVTYDHGWKTISVSIDTLGLTSAQLTNAIILIHSNSRSDDFDVDDLSITQDTTDKYIYRQLISSSTNPYGTANANGVYYIDCEFQTLVIERSRIVGTLVIANPGANSRIGDAPMNWAPAKPGYPVLLVNGNFQIQAPNTDLGEATSGVNFNPLSTPYYSSSPTSDDDMSDAYPWSHTLRGLVAINGDLTYQNTPRITGRVIVSGSTTNSPSLQYSPESLLSPPPEFFSERHEHRNASVRKAVLP